MYRPAKVARPACGQLEENEYISLSPFTPKNLVSREVRPSRPASVRSFSTIRLHLVLTHGVPPAFRDSVHSFIPSSANASVPSSSGHAKGRQWCSLTRIRRHRTSSPQGSCSDGCCLFRCHHGPINARFSFPGPTIIGMSWTCAVQKV